MQKIYNKNMDNKKIIVNKKRLNEVLEFHKSMPHYAKTDLIEIERNIFIKSESNRFSLNSFKILGVSYAMYRYFKDIYGDEITDYESLIKTIINEDISIYTATDGNFGIAVSYMCCLLKIKCTIIIPENIPTYYLNIINKYNSNIIIIDGNYDECVTQAICKAKETNNIAFLDTQIVGYDSNVPEYVIEGYMTMFMEMFDIDVDYLIVPAGVGGLAAAAIRFYNAINRDTRIISVEPQNYNCVMLSIEKGEIVSVHGGETIINGLKCGKPSIAAWHDLKYGLYAACCIDDNEALEAYELLNAKKILTGYTGACAFTLTQIDEFIDNKKILVLNTEYSY